MPAARCKRFLPIGSTKHLRDIRGMLAVSGDSIDLPALGAACAKSGLAAEWLRAKSES